MKRILFLVVIVFLVYSLIKCKNDDGDSADNNNSLTGSNLIKRVIENNGDYSIFKYDKNGKLITVEDYDSGAVKSYAYSKYYYGSDSKISKHERYSEDNLIYYQIYTYAGNIMTITEYDDSEIYGDFKQENKYVCSLDPSSRITRIDEYKYINEWIKTSYSIMEWEKFNLKKIELYQDTSLKKKNYISKPLPSQRGAFKHMYDFATENLKKALDFTKTTSYEIISYDNKNNPYVMLGSNFIFEYLVTKNNPLSATEERFSGYYTEKILTSYQYEYNNKNFPLKSIEWGQYFVNDTLQVYKTDIIGFEYY